MNTFIKNMLLFIGKMKRSKSEGESNGEKRIFWENMTLTGSNPGGAMGKKAR